MIARVLSAWIQDLNRKPVDPDQRLQLAMDVLQNGSPFSLRRNLDTTNEIDVGGSVVEQTLVSIPKQDNWVTVLESFDFRYVNPSGDDTIDAYQAMLRIANAETWLLPRFAFGDDLDSIFGPKKLLNGPFVVTREQNVQLVLNPGLAVGTAPAIFQVLTRFVIRYEPQWLMERLGLVEPENFPDKGKPVLGGR